MPDHRSCPAHTCLVGPAFARDGELTALLAPEFLVTLVPEAALLVNATVLTNVDILLLDCAPEPTAALALVPELKRQHPSLDIVLVDGGITQHQLANAFAEGARDYFPADCEHQLLVGRIRGLARQRRAARPAPPSASAADKP